MDTDKLQSLAKSFLKRWWASLLLIPFIIYSIHHYYWALRYNIFFAVNYDYPFPLGIVHFFVDNFLLIAHEAGHTFFRIFGSRFITILGGSLFQIILPLLIVAFCWVNRKHIGLQFSLGLAGYSWLDVAAYAADGSARQLPLIGGLGKEAHDWYNLLVRMDALQSDVTIGVTFMGIGIFFYAAALVVPFFYREYEEVDLELNLE
ncbi:MAG: hypothetical protein U5J63_01640 [Fodinibius sp.]|nr:hypothetical protein [Fodinibius sp.]